MEAIKEKDDEIEQLRESIKAKEKLIEKLRRVPVERANAERGIKNKKHNLGYLVQSSTAHWERLPNDPDYGFEAWKTQIQIPYKTDSWCWYEIKQEVREELSQRVFLDLYYDDVQDISDETIYSIYKKVKNEPDPLYIYNVIPKMNLKTGYWEVTVHHTREIRVPEHMLPPQMYPMKDKQETSKTE